MQVTTVSRPSIEEIEAEAQLAEGLLKRTVERINSSDSKLEQLLHLELCKAEQQAYLAGLLYALGHPTLLDRLQVLYDLDLSDSYRERELAPLE